MLGVYRGTALDALTEVACNDDIDNAAEDLRSRAQFAVTAGQTYYFQVGAYSDQTNPVVGGNLTFNLIATVVEPAGDRFAAPVATGALPFTRAGLDTHGASSEANEPVPTCAKLGKSVWFRYTPAADATVVADTVGSDFDTVLAVHRGTALGALTEVACADDIDRAGDNLRSRAQFAVTAGQTYYVQVGGFAEADGTTAAGVLTLQRWRRPPQTRDQQRVRGRHRGDRAAVHADGAWTPARRPRETGETVPSCTQGIARTVWFRYVAPADATLSLDTLGSDFDTVLGVYRGTALDALTQVACSDDIDAQAGNQRSRAEFGVSAGQTYYLQAGGYYDGTIALGGTLALNLAAVAPARRDRDRPGDRVAEHLARGDVQLRRGGRDGLRVPARRRGVRARAPRRRPTARCADGQHTFVVRALWAGDRERRPTTRTWTVDATAPDTALAGGPAEGSTATAREATFALSSEAGAAFECRLDGGAWDGCGSHAGAARPRRRPAPLRSPGARRGRQRRRQPRGARVDGRRDRARHGDRRRPGAARRRARDARLEFTSEPGASFECRLDGAGFAPCGSPVAYAALPDGAHAFEVRARDGAGNVDGSPAHALVDGRRHGAGHGAGVGAGRGVDERPRRDARFGFGSEPGAGFECRLDGAAFAPCGSPQAYAGLPDGAHRFEVRARDALGNVDGSPAQRNWTVRGAGQAPCSATSVSGQKLAGALRRGVLVRFQLLAGLPPGLAPGADGEGGPPRRPRPQGARGGPRDRAPRRDGRQRPDQAQRRRPQALQARAQGPAHARDGLRRQGHGAPASAAASMRLAVGLALVLAALAAPAHAATAPELARTLGRQGIVDIDPGVRPPARRRTARRLSDRPEPRRAPSGSRSTTCARTPTCSGSTATTSTACA